MSEWINSGDKMPPIGEYVLGCAGIGCPVFITRYFEDEWETGANRKRPCYLGKEMFKTSADADYWMPLPEAPQ